MCDDTLFVTRTNAHASEVSYASRARKCVVVIWTSFKLLQLVLFTMAAVGTIVAVLTLFIYGVALTA